MAFNLNLARHWLTRAFYDLSHITADEFADATAELVLRFDLTITEAETALAALITEAAA